MKSLLRKMFVVELHLPCFYRELLRGRRDFVDGGGRDSTLLDKLGQIHVRGKWEVEWKVHLSTDSLYCLLFGKSEPPDMLPC